jgi:hypothetical protein|nr:MAG TPA: hypothetical protein [Caudoviricetes sp.]
MKKKRITYGVSGMMEYQTIIRFGKNTLKVTFTGGSMNAIGVTPATFTTNNFLIQQAIENSSEFTRGRICIVKVVELDEELRIERAKPAPVAVPKNVAEAPAISKAPAAPEAEGVNIVEDTKGETVDRTAPTTEPLPEKQENVATMTQVEFSCNDDAKDYLEQTFSCIRSKLRNREDIINAGKAHNVEIIFV